MENAIDVKRLKNTVQDSRKTRNILIFGTDFYRKGVDIAIKSIGSDIKLSEDYKLKVVTHDTIACKKLIIEKLGQIPKFVDIVSPEKDMKVLFYFCLPLDMKRLAMFQLRQRTQDYKLLHQMFLDKTILRIYLLIFG